MVSSWRPQKGKQAINNKQQRNEVEEMGKEPLVQDFMISNVKENVFGYCLPDASNESSHLPSPTLKLSLNMLIIIYCETLLHIIA